MKIVRMLLRMANCLRMMSMCWWQMLLVVALVTEYPMRSQVNRIVCHPTLPVTITAHEDRHIRFFDNNSGQNCVISHLHVIIIFPRQFRIAFLRWDLFEVSTDLFPRRFHYCLFCRVLLMAMRRLWGYLLANLVGCSPSSMLLLRLYSADSSCLISFLFAKHVDYCNFVMCPWSI